MEFLPSKLLLNVFERLNISDAGSCRLLNRRYDEIIMNNWRKINKRRGSLEFRTYEGDFYSLTLKTKEASNVFGANKTKFTKCFIFDDRIQVLHDRKKEFSVVLARRLGAPDPISKHFMNMEIVNYSGEKTAFEAVMSLMQMKLQVDTLEVDDIKDEHLNLIISNIPKHSIHSLHYVNQRYSNDVLAILNKIGFEDVRDLVFVRGNKYNPSTVSNDLMNELLPQVPFKNIYTRSYFVSFPLILQVIKNWVNSNWEISLCSFHTIDLIDWKKEIEFLNPELEMHVNRYQEFYIIRKKTDEHTLRMKITRSRNRDGDITCIRLYEDGKYKSDFFT